ncbi:SUKH-4 family immunity protein [Streptomyces peucetius]|uniref:SUKH-4 family immunity protein n=1 Tax=Streptomyces peucetius TaxID=1950 RepID=A0ABY6I9A0_STRPE|nr:SUKH-4 family immunity protein [Streptomyces peucetius]UYQ62557.1 SUKH-4 family immunity protein [Streptomyces peucetius]
MVTFAQAQERAEEWVNGDVPAYQHREVRVREFDLGFVVWAEDREQGARSDGGRQRLVIARDSGEATLWPGLPVGEVIRRYEEEYGGTDDAPAASAGEAPQRVDLNQTSFLLSPPEWLQDAADKLGIPDRRASSSGSAEPAGPGEAAAAASSAGAGSGAGSAPVPDVSPSPGAEAAGPSPAGSGARDVPGSIGGNASQATGSSSWSSSLSSPSSSSVPSSSSSASPAPVSDAGSSSGAGADASQGGAAWPSAGAADHEPTASDGVPARPSGGTGWTDTSSAGGDDASVPLPATVFAPQVSADDGRTPPPVSADAPTALMSGGSQLPKTAIVPGLSPQPQPQSEPESAAPSGATPPPAPGAGAADIADAATSKAVLPPRGARGGTGATPPPPPGAPGTPGARPGAGATPPPSGPGAPGAPAGGYLPTQLVSQLGPEGPQPPGPPGPPPAPGSTPPPGGGVHHAATMLAGPAQMGPGAPQPPGPPGPPPAPGSTPPPPGPPAPPGSTPPPGGGVHHAATMLAGPAQMGPGAPQPPGPPGPPAAPGSTPPPGGGVHHAATMLAGPAQMGPGAPQPPGPPGPVPNAPQPQPPMGGGRPPYGYPQQPTGVPTVGPGYQAVLRYRAPDGSEAQLIRRSAPGTPHPEWQILHELRGMNVPPQQVLELHTELESCELPGAYCARMIRETWPQARITSIAPYGSDHASRQQGMQQLLAHQGELHQVADGPARPAPVRAPLPHVPPAPPIPPEGVAHELAGAFGPQGLCRFDQRAVSRQGVPEIVAATLVWAGLPGDFNPFFWAQPAQPVVPTLAELAAQRQVQPASDAGSYLVIGSDFGRAICVQYGTAHIVAVPVEAGPGGAPVAPQFVNTGLPEFVRCLALLGRMWPLRFGLNPEQAGRWTVDFQAQLAAFDPAALSSPESWWSVLLEQMWDGLL